MNRAVRALGLASTRFGNPHGMMHDRHQATAWDMAVLAVHAMRDRVLQRIAATRRHAVTLETVRYASPPPAPSLHRGVPREEGEPHSVSRSGVRRPEPATTGGARRWRGGVGRRD